MAAVRVAAAALLAALAQPAWAGPADRWSAYTAEASRRFGIPEDWIRRVMIAESGGRTLHGGRPITSRAGAMGLMQLMPGTWAEVRSVLALGFDPHQPRDNILAGTYYLRAMYDRFGYPGLFAAYNAGPARYAAHLAQGRPLPGETRAYLRKLAPNVRAPLPVATAPQALFVPPLNGDRQPPPGKVDQSVAQGLFVPLSGEHRH